MNTNITGNTGKNNNAGNKPTQNSGEPRVNDQIKASLVRVVDQDGNMLGVMHPLDAIKKAKEAGLDLIEISPNASPPVCKLLDYGKYKYQAQKKANEARKKQKVIEVKEIKIRPGIDKHDYEIKLRAMKKFIEDGDKVKVTLRFRGREMAHSEIGFALFKRIKEDMGETIKVENEARMEGKQAIMIIAPAPAVVK